MRSVVLWAGLALGATTLAVEARDARACGGCFNAPPSPTMSGTVVTDHRMVFSASPTQTTLYDQIKYSGSPQDFAWVLPIKGAVQVGISSDALFAAIDSLTTTTIVAPQRQCPSPPFCGYCGGGGSSGTGGGLSYSGGSSSGGYTPPPVTVLSQSTVGPYDQVQLQSTNPMALSDWLATHGYVIPASVQPVITAYVNEGFDFLAIRLSPGTGVAAMVPISVTTPGAGVTLPLRMVAAGTGSRVGITLWVIASGRYEPSNFSSFSISGSDLTWDWGAMQSDYATIRTQDEAGRAYAAWQIESSTDVLPQQVESLVLYGNAYSGGVAGGGLIDAGSEYVPLYGDGGVEGGVVAQTAEQVRTKDLATCFSEGPASVRVTRMRADLAQAALASDLVLQAASDQSTLSNVYNAAKSINEPPCPTYPPCPVCSSGPGNTNPYGGGGLGVSSSGGQGGAGTGSHSSFGCSASSGESRTAWPETGIGVLVGLSLWRSRRKRDARGR